MFHLSLKKISRGDSRSATAAAAYRSGQTIQCDRSGLTHNYTKRSGVEATFLTGWAGTRSELWNAAEFSESRSNAVVAREIIVNLPFDVPPTVRHSLTSQIVQFLRDRYEVAIDTAIHVPSKKGDQRNFHAHILFTTRSVGQDQRFGAKTRVLDDLKSGPQEIEVIRAKWAEILNSHWAKTRVPNGPIRKVDHRSFKRRGLHYIPTRHEGPKSRAKYYLKKVNESIRVANTVFKELIDEMVAKKLAEKKLELSKFGEHKSNELTENKALADKRIVERPKGQPYLGIYESDESDDDDTEDDSDSSSGATLRPRTTPPRVNTPRPSQGQRR